MRRRVRMAETVVGGGLAKVVGREGAGVDVGVGVSPLVAVVEEVVSRPGGLVVSVESVVAVSEVGIFGARASSVDEHESSPGSYKSVKDGRLRFSI